MGTLVIGRLAPSSLPTPTVARNALHQLLESALTRRVCVVQAGPGWGKTAALARGFTHLPVEVGSLDTSDEDLRRLMSALLESRPSEVSALLEEFGWAEPVDELILVLDDADELFADGELAALGERLCRHAPPWVHVALISRRDPPFPLHRLRGQGVVAEVDARQLAFTTDDVEALLAATVGAGTGMASDIRHLTGGWPAAVRMVADALTGVAAEHRGTVLDELTSPGGRLWSYLVDEVLPGEPESVRALLGQMAVLDGVTRPLCSALGFDEADAVLPDLTRRGLVQFVADPEGTWSLIPMAKRAFADPQGLSPESESALRRRAADLLVGQGAYARALPHLIEAGEYAATRDILVKHGTELVDSGHADAVLGAAGAVTTTGNDPQLQGVVGYAQQVRGYWSSAQASFQRAVTNADQLDPELAWQMGLVPYSRGEFDLALALYDQARLGLEDTRDGALVLAWTAAAYRMIGDDQRCRQAVDRAAAAAERCNDPGAWAATCTVQAMLASSAGDPRDADAFFHAALRWAHAAGDSQQVLRITVNRAGHLLELGLLAECMEQVELAQRLDETGGNVVPHACVLTARGWVRALRGELEPAVTDFGAACEAFQSIGSRLLAWPLIGLGYLHRIRGELANARATYEEALALAEPHHEALGLVHALTGLARVRAADDLPTALELAERAVAVDEGAARVGALLTRGWVRLLAGEHDLAAADAERAAARARARRDRPGLAEALELTAFALADRDRAIPLLTEAAQVWAELGYRIEEGRSRLIIAYLIGRNRRTAGLLETAAGQVSLRLDQPHAAGPLAALTRAVPAVSICTLGIFRVLRNGKPVPSSDWQSKMARDLLKILVARRGPVPRERLMDLLWPDEDPSRASKRLSVLISTVRGVLGPLRQFAVGVPVVTDRDAVWLDLDQVDVDVEEFMTAATAALELPEEGAENAIAALTAAEACYSGDFLADDPYQEWADPLREEARALYAAVLRALVGRLRKTGDVDRAVRYALRLLGLDPYDEVTHLELVRTLIERGRRGEAGRRYQEYVRRMAELGVTPEPSPDQRIPPDAKRAYGDARPA